MASQPGRLWFASFGDWCLSSGRTRS